MGAASSTESNKSLVKAGESSKRLPAESQRGRKRAFDVSVAPLDPRNRPHGSYNLTLALACSPDPRFRQVLDRLDRPRYQRWSLAAVARSCDITMPEFMAFWRDAQLEAAIDVGRDSLIDVVRDMSEASIGRYQVCERCDGMTWLNIDESLSPNDVPGYMVLQNGKPVRTCPYCQGRGIARQEPDVDAREKIMEMNGYGKRGAVRIVQKFGGASLDQTMAKMPAMMLDLTAESVDDEKARE